MSETANGAGETAGRTNPAPLGPYHLTVDLNVLNHLGFSLYSSVPAVLSEVIANCWDADAENVTITLDRKARTVIVEDDGTGMNLNDINERFLKVGYQKRKEVTVTAKGRHVMGRKGIGKLSLFSIASNIQVHSAKVTASGTERNGFVMDATEIQKKIGEKGGTYYPQQIDASKITVDRGTRLVLSQLATNLTTTTEKALRRRLARRFSVIGPEFTFSVVVDDKPILVEDRELFAGLEYMWTVGDEGKALEAKATKVKRFAHVDGIVDAELDYKVSGWIGTFDEQKSIEEGENSIVVLAWGKLVHEDVLRDIKRGGLFTKYVSGEIRADFLDTDDKPDIATTDRQHLKEDDPRFVKLRKYIDENVLAEIDKRWREFRADDSETKAKSNPAIDEWFKTLSTTNKKYARQLFAKIESFPINDPAYKRELYKNGILAFEKLALRENLEALDKVETQADLELIEAVFGGIDDLEAAEYHSIVRGRLEVIKSFEALLPEARERVIQKYLFDHLWLLHPSWERASTNQKIEQSVAKEFDDITAKLKPEEKAGRVDIRYRTAAGKHIIIELKKYNVKVSAFDLAEQIAKYRSGLEKVLRAKFPEENRVIECIAVLGSPPSPEDQEEMNLKVLTAVGARYITYDTLIAQTLESYQDYLIKNKKLSELLKLIESI